jgi:hypothetical protein
MKKILNSDWLRAAPENEVGIRQCRPKYRPINLPGRQIFADLNLAKR